MISYYYVFHSDGDADLFIVNKTVKSSQTSHTTAVSEDTDLLVLLFFYARNSDPNNVIFHPEPKTLARKKPVMVSIQSVVKILGKICVKHSIYTHTSRV